MFQNLRETTVLVCEMFTSGFRPRLKNVACMSSLISMVTITNKRIAIRVIMVMTKNNYDNDDDDDLQLNKMYEEYENKIVLLISPAIFPGKKLPAQEHLMSSWPRRSAIARCELKKLLLSYCDHFTNKEFKILTISLKLHFWLFPLICPVWNCPLNKIIRDALHPRIAIQKVWVHNHNTPDSCSNLDYFNVLNTLQTSRC